MSEYLNKVNGENDGYFTICCYCFVCLSNSSDYWIIKSWRFGCSSGYHGGKPKVLAFDAHRKTVLHITLKHMIFERIIWFGLRNTFANLLVNRVFFQTIAFWIYFKFNSVQTFDNFFLIQCVISLNTVHTILVRTLVEVVVIVVVLVVLSGLELKGSILT